MGMRSSGLCWGPMGKARQNRSNSFRLPGLTNSIRLVLQLINTCFDNDYSRSLLSPGCTGWVEEARLWTG